MDNKKRYIPVAVIVTGIIVITGLFIWYQKKPTKTAMQLDL